MYYTMPSGSPGSILVYYMNCYGFQTSPTSTLSMNDVAHHSSISHSSSRIEHCIVSYTNLRISSIMMTRKLMYKTAFHSAEFKGVMVNKDWLMVSSPVSGAEKARHTVKNKGMSRIAKCQWSAMLGAFAATRKGLRHTRSFNRLSFSDSEFMALNNSIVTRIDKLMVVARCTMALVNISQPIPGKRAEH